MCVESMYLEYKSIYSILEYEIILVKKWCKTMKWKKISL